MHKIEVLLADQHFLDELLVDLQIIEREPLQVAQRGITRAEIIEGKAETGDFEPRKNRLTMIDIMDEGIFRHFQTNLSAGEADIRNRILDPLDIFVMQELGRRNVHRYVQCTFKNRIEYHCVLACPAQNPMPDIVNGAALLGDTYKLIRTDLAKNGIFPAQ